MRSRPRRSPADDRGAPRASPGPRSPRPGTAGPVASVARCSGRTATSVHVRWDRVKRATRPRSGRLPRCLRHLCRSSDARLAFRRKPARRGGIVETTGKAAVAEFIGTFALIFFGAGTIIATGNGDTLAIAFAHGLAIAIMVSLMVHISGGVFNPAIQAALWVTGRMPTGRSAVYIAAQLAGAVAAAALLKYFFPAAAFDSV